MPSLLIVLGLVVVAATAHAEELNVAVSKPAYQINNYDGGTVAGVAVDNHEGQHHVYSAITGSYTGHLWWMVDLLSVFRLTKVKLRRRDATYTRFKDVSVWTSAVGYEYPGSGTPDWSKFNKSGEILGQLGGFEEFPMAGIYARYVAVRKYGNSHLELSEAQVFAKVFKSPLESEEPLSLVGRTCKMIGGSSSASKMVDGDIGMCAISGHYAYPWWVTDMGNEYDVTKVRIHNIIGSYPERHRNVAVYVAPAGGYNNGGAEPIWSKFTKCGQTIQGRMGDFADLTCAKKSQFVAVRVLISTYFNLCELQVFTKNDRKGLGYHLEFDNKIAPKGPHWESQERSEFFCALKCVQHDFCLRYGFTVVSPGKVICHMYASVN